MATVHCDDIARLIPTTPPGATADHIHSAARHIWPGISPGSVLMLLGSLIHDRRVTRVDGGDNANRYHLTETP